MNLAVLSESPVDEAALRVFAEAVLGSPVTWVQHRHELRGRGYAALRLDLLAVARDLHYHRGADGVVLVADADPPALPQGASRPADIPRLAELRQVRDEVLAHLQPRQGRASLRIAIGVAVPAIEAWYLHSREPNVTEAAFLQGPWRGKQGFELRRELKRLAYTERGRGRDAEIAQAVEDAQRLAQDISLLERDFPQGFGSLADELRAWSDE